MVRTLQLGICAVALGLAAPALAADVSEITTEDFYGAFYFKNALEYPAVAKMESRKGQIRKVAADMGWTPSQLAAAIEKVDSVEGDLLEQAKQGILDGFKGTRLEGKVLDVYFNTDEPKHVVAYLRWRGSHSTEVIKEASTIAHVVHERAPFVSTASIAAIHPNAPDTSKTPVWSAKIGHASMSRINPDRIEDYADRLYQRMFESVKAVGPY